MKEANQKKCVYLDYNGTTPVYPQVLEAMLPYLTDHFGNPSSSHYFGSEPKAAVNKARRSLLSLIQAVPVADPSSIMFTGCGTESNNVAIRLALLSSTHKANRDNGLLHVVTTNIEHPAITQCLNSYISGSLTPKITVTEVPVDEFGVVSSADVIDAIQENTALVTIMTANNEVGSLQPVFEIAKICRQKQILFHTDAAQAVGKIDLRGLAEETTGADMVTIVGHKFGAPKGIAALYIRPNCLDESGRVNPEHGGSVLLMGGGQEGGRRGGTENVPYIAGIGRAADMLFDQHGDKAGWEANALHMQKMRLMLLEQITVGLKESTGQTDLIRVNGPLNENQRLPNTLSIGLKGVQSGRLLHEIGGVVACSSGSACHSSSGPTMSYSAILKAMNVPPDFAVGTLRLSVGPNTSQEDVDLAADIIVKEATRQLKS
eukprot:CAMPEP_0201740066 /NCGR_PEP_ID=MMETSP0593-20130828/46111_1 /ASSEMBLY_ACC=CAM_ASM_000672 /TAXON_ID=267983 /ORGANISM="Skeletonema japonicum, Strain CCMP2506" /LENGTH=431 /DNA_ID=CAMNT_0048234369 /DNA_START=95 /DNA_END=1390 /DNA_ORIENTATION=+